MGAIIGGGGLMHPQCRCGMLGDSGISSVVFALLHSDTTHVKSIWLDNTALTDAGALQLAELLSDRACDFPNLEVLNVKHNELLTAESSARLEHALAILDECACFCDGDRIRAPPVLEI